MKKAISQRVQLTWIDWVLINNFNWFSLFGKTVAVATTKNPHQRFDRTLETVYRRNSIGLIQSDWQKTGGAPDRGNTVARYRRAVPNDGGRSSSVLVVVVVGGIRRIMGCYITEQITNQRLQPPFWSHLTGWWWGWFRLLVGKVAYLERFELLFMPQAGNEVMGNFN